MIISQYVYFPNWTKNPFKLPENFPLVRQFLAIKNVPLREMFQISNSDVLDIRFKGKWSTIISLVIW